MTSASVPASEAPPLRDAHERRIPAPVFWELVAHLARRQLDTKHQLTLLGWAWPLTRQLAQLAVLVFIFSAVFDLGIDDFPVFIFIGLIAWTWFATGVGDGAWSITGQRHMILLSRLPKAALPLVAVVVPLVDVIIAFPVLLLMLAIGDELTVDGMVLRYKVDETDDGLEGEEGTFAICSFWMVSALAEIGELQRARHLCEKLLSYASPLQLYAEEIDARTGRHLGNFPQAFTHLALINAVMHVIRADLRHDVRSFATPRPLQG